MINVTKSYLPDKDIYFSYISRIWDSFCLTNRGPLACELEEKLKQHLGINHILFVNNGTTAIQIAIKALEIKGEIITTPFSYVATTSSIVWEGCKPVFADIDPDTLNISPSSVESMINENTSAIIATHVYGIPCDVKALEALARKYKLKLIFDAAHCFGVNYMGKSLLEYGDVSTLSFHATKLFHTGEGGAIVVNDPVLVPKIFYMHNFGHNGQEAFHGLGINGKNSELHAAMGLSVLHDVDKIIQRRKELSEYYDIHINEMSLKRPVVPNDTKYNYSYYPVLFNSEQQLLEVKKSLNENSIFPRRYFYPCLNTLNYVNNSPTIIASDISSRILCLPLYFDLEKTDLERICRIIKEVL